MPRYAKVIATGVIGRIGDMDENFVGLWIDGKSRMQVYPIGEVEFIDWESLKTKNKNAKPINPRLWNLC